MKVILIISLSFLLSACVYNYLYTSRATLVFSDEQPRGAVMYWRADEGRMWFGGKADGGDSDVDVRVCGSASTLSFLPNENSGELELVARSGDILIAGYNEDNQVIPLESPERAMPSKTACGHILIGSEFATMDDLVEGIDLMVTVLCKNNRFADRYASASSYAFSAIVKNEGENPDPSACDAQ